MPSSFTLENTTDQVNTAIQKVVGNVSGANGPDSFPVVGSEKLVESGGVAAAIANIGSGVNNLITTESFTNDALDKFADTLSNLDDRIPTSKTVTAAINSATATAVNTVDNSMASFGVTSEQTFNNTDYIDRDQIGGVNAGTGYFTMSVGNSPSFIGGSGQNLTIAKGLYLVNGSMTFKNIAVASDNSSSSSRTNQYFAGFQIGTDSLFSHSGSLRTSVTTSSRILRCVDIARSDNTTATRGFILNSTSSDYNIMYITATRNLKFVIRYRQQTDSAGNLSNSAASTITLSSANLQFFKIL